MDLIFLLKCMMGLYDLDLPYYLVSADNSNYSAARLAQLGERRSAEPEVVS